MCTAPTILFHLGAYLDSETFDPSPIEAFIVLKGQSTEDPRLERAGAKVLLRKLCFGRES